jgi:hypothetical protein
MRDFTAVALFELQPIQPFVAFKFFRLFCLKYV